MATSAELLEQALRIQQNIKPVIIPAVFPSADQTSKTVYSLDPKAFALLIQAIGQIGSIEPVQEEVATLTLRVDALDISVNTLNVEVANLQVAVASLQAAGAVRIDGAEPDANAKLATALADGAISIVLTGTFNLTSSLAVRTGPRVLYLADAVLNFVLSDPNRGAFELEDCAFIELLMCTSSITMTGNGGGNSVFRGANNQFSVQIDGGWFGMSDSSIVYNGVNSRGFDSPAPGGAYECRVRHIAMTGSGVGEQLASGGGIHSYENGIVTSNFVSLERELTGATVNALRAVFLDVEDSVINISTTVNPGAPLVEFNGRSFENVTVNLTVSGGLGAMTGINALGIASLAHVTVTTNVGVGSSLLLNIDAAISNLAVTHTGAGTTTYQGSNSNPVYALALNAVAGVTLAAAAMNGVRVTSTGPVQLTATTLSDVVLTDTTGGLTHTVACKALSGLVASATVGAPSSITLANTVANGICVQGANLAIGTAAFPMNLVANTTTDICRLANVQVSNNLTLGAGTTLRGVNAGIVGTADATGGAMVLRASTAGATAGGAVVTDP